MEREEISGSDEIFEHLSSTLGAGVRYEDGDFEMPDSDVVKKLLPLAKCRYCSFLLHEEDTVKNTGRYREDPVDDGKLHGEKYGHTVDIVLEQGSSYELITVNER